MTDAVQFVLLERDGHEIYFHGCVTIPPGRDERDVARIYRTVMESSEEWNYDDIHKALAAEGFHYVPSAKFWEHDA
jgi:hypothetical protein